MGIKRIVDTGFWLDGKLDEFSPDEKYFYLYLLTNPFTTQLGIYELSIRQAAFQLGWPVQTVNELLARFQDCYGLIRYCRDTNEVAVLNYLRHSIVKGGAPVRDCLVREIRKVKNRALIDEVFDRIRSCEQLNETVRRLVEEYDRKKTDLAYSNEKENEKDNDNEVSSPVSRGESGNDSSRKRKKKYFSSYCERQLDSDELQAIRRMMEESGQDEP